jgi:hypothetical protein
VVRRCLLQADAYCTYCAGCEKCDVYRGDLNDAIDCDRRCNVNVSRTSFKPIYARRKGSQWGNGHKGETSCELRIYHSNSLCGISQVERRGELLISPCTLGKKIIFSIDVNHTIFQDAFPLVLNTRNLDSELSGGRYQPNIADLVISAKYDVRFSGTTFFGVLLTFCIRVIQVTIDGLRVQGSSWQRRRRCNRLR